MKKYGVKSLLLCLALLTITLTVFWQAGNFEFINLDDPIYVTSNLQVQSGFSRAGIFWAFTSTTEANWHPLTWLSHMADCQMFGLDPAGHHMVNVFLHATNSLLLFLLLFRISGSYWQSAFVSALFALHPLHVESVAWVAERKDVLSTLFWLLSIQAYVGYVSRPVPWRYFLALLLFSLGLMAKAMVVTLPFLLFLLDFWPLGRYRHISSKRLVLEKIPFLFLASATSVITYFAQHKEGAVVSFAQVPTRLRMENAIVSYTSYLSKMIWPSNLAIYYPFQFEIPLWQVIGSFLLLACISMLVIRQWRRFPYLIVGWFWYLITLVPVVGFVKVGSQSMADRYTYVPLIGVFIMLAWSAPELVKECRWRNVLLGVPAVVVLTIFALCTYRQLGYWQNSITIYRHSISATFANLFIVDNLASAYFERGNLNEAIEQSNLALKIDPNDFLAHFLLGLIYDRQEKISSAIFHYREAVRIKPDYIEALNNLGRDLVMEGDYEKARACFLAILELDPSNPNAEYNLNFISQRIGL